MNPLTLIRDLVYQRRFTESLRLLYLHPDKKIGLSYLLNHSTEPSAIRKHTPIYAIDPVERFLPMRQFNMHSMLNFWPSDHDGSTNLSLSGPAYGFGSGYGNGKGGGIGDGADSFIRHGSRIPNI